MRVMAAMLCVLAAPALADVAGPEAVFDGGWDCRANDLGIPGWLNCLRDLRHAQRVLPVKGRQNLHGPFHCAHIIQIGIPVHLPNLPLHPQSTISAGLAAAP